MKRSLVLILVVLATAAYAKAPLLTPEAQAAGDAWCQSQSGDAGARFLKLANPSGPRVAYCRLFYGRKAGVSVLMIGEAPEAVAVRQ